MQSKLGLCVTQDRFLMLQGSGFYCEMCAEYLQRLSGPWELFQLGSNTGILSSTWGLMEKSWPGWESGSGSLQPPAIHMLPGTGSG